LSLNMLISAVILGHPAAALFSKPAAACQWGKNMEMSIAMLRLGGVPAAQALEQSHCSL
jgi:hypothetical protein